MSENNASSLAAVRAARLITATLTRGLPYSDLSVTVIRKSRVGRVLGFIFKEIAAGRQQQPNDNDVGSALAIFPKT